MSIPSSYFTTMAWEKFVEKHDAFMRNSKTKVENEKRNKKLCFRLKWWFLQEFGSFRSCFTTSPSWHSVIELAFQDMHHMGRVVRMDISLVADVLDQSVSIWSSSVTWQRRLYSSGKFITHAVIIHLHEARQRPLRNTPFLDRLHPIGFSRGGV